MVTVTNTSANTKVSTYRDMASLPTCETNGFELQTKDLHTL